MFRRFWGLQGEGGTCRNSFGLAAAGSAIADTEFADYRMHLPTATFHQRPCPPGGAGLAQILALGW